MNNSLVSILIPNFNKGPFLRETLNSILQQEYQNWECIVVDDHSTDDSWATLEEFSAMDTRIHIFKRPRNLAKGGNVCRNYALTVSNGEFIQWFDSDDIMMSSLILDRLALLKSDPKLDFVVSSGFKFFNYLGDTDIVFSHVFYKNLEIESFISFDPAWLTQACLYRKKFLIECGLFWDESLTILQDVHYDLMSFLKASSIGYLDHKLDWGWRWQKFGENTGSQRGDFENLPSMKYLIESFSVLCRSYPDKKIFLKYGCYDLIRSTHKIFGFHWYKEFYLDSIRLLALHSFKKYFLTSTVFLLLSTKEYFPITTTIMVKIIIYINRLILLDKNYVRIFNTKTVFDFNDTFLD